ncbi:hypothetical protein LEM8419_00276 [Neolewinella maritima]|uniref:O-antigen ligase domain-containing protein n=1 Tax=Neolewinella maritima TaxID=1383882 RepID=A0ABN8F1M6_9BACT|nr:hypothetical protein [Neolewinella maritima]CAH0998981.1 hypothetical protein LEM8419_00276 [Neolewinella maritima]
MGWIRYLLPLYAISTLLPRLLQLPAPLHQVQLTECLFLPLLWVFRHDLLTQFRRYRVVSIILVLYAGLNLLSGLWAGTAGAILEGGARCYLVLVTIITLCHVNRYGGHELLRWWIWGTVAVAAFGLMYYSMIAWGVTDLLHWTSFHADYPYLGDVYRMRGTANTYGMWVMLLLPGFLMAYATAKQGSNWCWWIIGLATIPTLSKELLLLPLGVILLLPGRRYWHALVIAGLGIVLLVGTHWVVVPAATDLQTNPYTTDTALARGGDYQLVETVYLPIKRAAVRVGLAHPWLGVGPGQFAAYSTAASLPGEFVPHFGRFDPHSAWTGAFAETGLPGLLALLALVLALCYYRPQQLTVAAVLLLLFLLVSVFKDVMNFRGLWVVVGLYLYNSSNDLMRS